MPIQREIWRDAIIEGLFADNSVIARAFDADEYVTQGKVVHIPNAGAATGIIKNPSSFPVTAETREDSDVSFVIDTYAVKPVYVRNAEQLELSYDKLNSVLGQNKLALQDTVTKELFMSWAPTPSNKGKIIRTTGSAVAAHLSGTTGNRKAFTRSDVRNAMAALNKQGLPKEGRCMAIDSDMYVQLLDSLTEGEARAFHAQADVARGVIGKLYGFDIYERAIVVAYDSGATTVKDATSTLTAGDCAAALAWHDSCVCRALGEVTVYSQENAPQFYGDVVSADVKAGGRPMRADGKGVIAIVQSAA